MNWRVVSFGTAGIFSLLLAVYNLVADLRAVKDGYMQSVEIGDLLLLVLMAVITLLCACFSWNVRDVNQDHST